MRRQVLADTGKGPCDYVELPDIRPDWRVLDVGPGRYPLRRADAYVDFDADMLAAIPEGKEKYLTSIEYGLPQIADKSFDFVWCSHVLEHVEDVEVCARTLSRIGKSGVIVLPSAFKDALFNFDEPDHKWWILPAQSGAPIFIRHNKRFLERIIDNDVQKIACRLFRLGTAADLPDDQYARDWFRRTEPDLDIVYHWSGELKLTVIR